MSSDVDAWVAWAAYGQLASKAFAISPQLAPHLACNVSVLPYRLGAVVRKVDSAASVYAVRDKPVVLAPEYRTVTRLLGSWPDVEVEREKPGQAVRALVRRGSRAPGAAPA
jgi:hypothetical protein